jgi:hypothetical protein
MPDSRTWLFKPRFRQRAFSWHGSKTAIARLREATSEIKGVARSDPITAAEGFVVLAERLWPALQDIDTSSGALGNAVNTALDELLPIFIAAPAERATRKRWLQRLYWAVQEDGVQYLCAIEDRWGEAAVLPELMNAYADDLLPLLRRVWTLEPTGGYVVGTSICLSSLLEAGRYDELLALLHDARTKLWAWQRYGAEALSRQGLWEAAIAFAEGCKNPRLAPYDDLRIDRFCEDILIRAGRADQAYRRYGLHTVRAPTYLATYRETVRRYPDRDRRQVLLDLIAARGERGKWFAAAKAAAFLDIALECAGSVDAEPATLVRATRDFSVKEPRFALEVGLNALQHMIAGEGFEPEPLLAYQAADYCAAAAARIGLQEWTRQKITELAMQPRPSGETLIQRALTTWLKGENQRPMRAITSESESVGGRRTRLTWRRR